MLGIITPAMTHAYSRPFPSDYGYGEEGFARYQAAEAHWMAEHRRLVRNDLMVHAAGIGTAVLIGIGVFLFL